MTKFIPFVSYLLLAAATTQAPAMAQQTCANYAVRIDQALLPQVGSTQLVDQMIDGVDAWTDSGISAGFDPRAAARVLGDALRAARSCPNKRDREAAPEAFACEYAARGDSRGVLDVDMRDGRVTYLNPDRRFDPAGGDNPTTSDQVGALAQSLAQALGVPANEFSLAQARVRAVRLRSVGQAQGLPAVDRKKDVIVLVPRQVNGWRVFDSKLQVVADQQGKIARAHLAWPDFTISSALPNAAALSREAIITAALEHLGEAVGCDALTQFGAQVGWGEMSLSAGDDSETSETSGRYVPVVRIIAAPPSSEGGPGQYEGMVTVFDLPLVGIDGSLG